MMETSSNDGLEMETTKELSNDNRLGDETFFF